MSWDFWARLRPGSARYDEWRQVFGTEAQLGESGVQVPIATPISERVVLPIGVRTVRFLAVDQLTASQKARLVVYLAVKFRVDPQEVQDEIERQPRHSVPLLDEELYMAVLHPQWWF